MSIQFGVQNMGQRMSQLFTTDNVFGIDKENLQEKGEYDRMGFFIECDYCRSVNELGAYTIYELSMSNMQTSGEWLRDSCDDVSVTGWPYWGINNYLPMLFGVDTNRNILHKRERENIFKMNGQNIPDRKRYKMDTNSVFDLGNVSEDDESTCSEDEINDGED